MAVKQEPRTGIWYDWVLGDNNWHTNMNANLKKLGLLFQLSAKSLSLATPPASPVNGDLYIVASSPTGAWVGHTNDLAIWLSAEAVWTFYTPRRGFLCDVEDLGYMVKWNGTAWAQADTGNPVFQGFSFRNYVFNPNFSIWQRGSSQTSSGYGSDDKWLNAHNGSTKTHSQQSFALGQTDVPNNPRFFSRTVVSSVAGVSNYVSKSNRMEDVTRLSGKNITLTFWAKADAAKNMAVELSQGFGSGGAPSASVFSIGVVTCALTTSWQKFTIPVTVPSVSGKTLGTDENSSYTALNFWFEAGTSFNVRTNSLIQQSGTFDIAQVQFEEGGTATSFEIRPIAVEEALCLRYYEQTYNDGTAAGTVTTAGSRSWQSPSTRTIKGGSGRMWRVAKRASPTVTIYSTNTGASGNIFDVYAGADIASTATVINRYGYAYLSGAAPVAGNNYYWQEAIDAEL